MTHLELDRRQEEYLSANPGPTGSVLRRSNRGTVLQWIAVVAVGALLGIFLLRVLSLPSPYPYLLTIAALVPFVAMIAGSVRKLLLAAVILDIPFQWGFHLNYDPAAGSLGALGGLGISLTTASVVALYALWFADLLANRRNGFRQHLRVSVPLALYVGFAVLSVAVARSIGFAFNEVFLLVQTLLLYVYIASTVRSRKDVLFVTTMLVLSLALESLVIIATQVLGPGFSLPGINTGVDPVASYAPQPARAIGTLHSPNVAAGFISLLMAPAFVLIVARRSGTGRKLLALFAFTAGALALLFTYSRGGWLAFSLSMAIVCILAVRRRWLSPVGPLAVLAIAVFLFAVFQEPILQRLGDAQAAAGRLPLIMLALQMIRDNPLLGVGANNFYVAMPQYLTPDYLRTWLYVVHDKYLLVWAETGIFALAAFLAFLVSTIRQGWRAFKLGDGLLSLIALGFTAAFVGQTVHMAFDIFSDQPQVQGLWTIAALITAMSNVSGGEGNGN